MEECQQVHHRKAAARLLSAGLTEGLLQGWGVGHRSARTIDKKSSMAVPPTLIEHRAAAQVMAECTQQVSQNRYWQPLPGLAIGLAATSDATQSRHMRARRVAVQDLENKQMHRCHRIQNTFTPHMINGSTDFTDQFLAEKLRHFALDLLHGSEDTAGHPWPPVRVSCEQTLF